MPLYEYVNTKTGKRFTKHLSIKDMDLPLNNPSVQRVVTAPNILGIGLDYGGTPEGLEKSKGMADAAIWKAQTEITRGIVEKSKKIKMTRYEKLVDEKLERKKWIQKVGKLIDT